MKYLTLEELLQQHFGLKGKLCKRNGTYTKAGYEAYEKFVATLGAVGNHIEGFMDAQLGKTIKKLIDKFDNYEHINN